MRLFSKALLPLWAVSLALAPGEIPALPVAVAQSTEPRLRLSRPRQAQPKAASAQSTDEPFKLDATKTHVLIDKEQQPQLAPQPALVDVFNGATANDALPLHAEKNGLSATQDNLPLKGKAVSQVRLLANYDVELIVDSSMSMRKRDCPGGLSRWSWCGVQARDLGKQIAPFVPRGLTITAFASDYNVYPNSTASNIADLFDNPNFRLGTRLAEPLHDRLQSFFARRRPGSEPLLIAVITDGVPRPRYEPQLVIETLIAASRQMKDAREVTVVFFQIGAKDRFGKAFLSYLDNDLTLNGARHDLVRTVDFDQLMQVGLAQALVDSIQDFANTHNTLQPSPKTSAPAKQRKRSSR